MAKSRGRKTADPGLQDVDEVKLLQQILEELQKLNAKVESLAGQQSKIASREEMARRGDEYELEDYE